VSAPCGSRLALVAALALASGCRDRAPEPAPADRAQKRARHMLSEAERCAAASATGREEACRTACDLGHSNSCHGAGALREADGERAGALALYTRACDGGSGLGCEAAGRTRRELGAGADGAEELDRRARFYLRVHCEQRHAPSCLVLGRLYTTSRGGPADRGSSQTFLERACTFGLAAACDR